MDGRVAAMTENIDPRSHYRDALAWVRTLASAVPADRMTDPTPCPEWDVRSMLGHLVATVDRARVIGEGGDPNAHAPGGHRCRGRRLDRRAVRRRGQDGGSLGRRRPARRPRHGSMGAGPRPGGGVGVPARGPRPRLGPRRRHRAGPGGRSGHGRGGARRDAAGDAGRTARRPDPVRRAGQPAGRAPDRQSGWRTGAGTPAESGHDGGRCSGTGSSAGARAGGNTSTGSPSGTCRSRRRTARPRSTPTNAATATHTASATTIQAIQPHTSVPLRRTSAHGPHIEARVHTPNTRWCVIYPTSGRAGPSRSSASTIR